MTREQCKPGARVTWNHQAGGCRRYVKPAVVVDQCGYFVRVRIGIEETRTVHPANLAPRYTPAAELGER